MKAAKLARLSKELLIFLFNFPRLSATLLKLWFLIFPKDPKGSLSTLLETSKSLNSVNYYCKQGFKALDLSAPNKAGKWKTLFILGSGPSINHISPEQWDTIQNNVSWGFNLWCCHEFIPNIYIAQNFRDFTLSKDENHSLNDLLKNILASRLSEYNGVEFYLRGDGVNNREISEDVFGEFLIRNFRDKISLISEYNIGSNSTILPSYYLKILRENNFFSPQSKLNPVPKFGSTIGELIALGIIQGYKKIVLCGIDMLSGEHFYDSEDYYLRYPYLRSLSQINNNRVVHEHMDKSKRSYTVKDYIMNLNKMAQIHFNTEIFVINSHTALYPEIPIYS